MQSKVEDARDFLALAFSGIDVNLGYRTTVKEVLKSLTDLNQCTNFPTVHVLLGDGSIEPESEGWNVLTQTNQVIALGYFDDELESVSEIKKTAGETAGEPLLHDMLRVIYLNALSELTSGNQTRFLIDLRENPLKIGRYFDYNSKRGAIAITFTIKIWMTDGAF